MNFTADLPNSVIPPQPPNRPVNTDVSASCAWEGLNTLLLMHERYGSQTDVYFKGFQRQWGFIKKYQIDPEFRGLYEVVERDGTPTNYTKAEICKAAYHDGRALLNVTERLRKMAQSTPK